MFSDFTATARAIAATTKKTGKETLLADLLLRLDDAALERAVVFFSGSPFPRGDERVTGVGWAAVAQAVAEAAGVTTDDVFLATQRHGDLGDAVAEFFPETGARNHTLVEAGELFDSLAATAGSLRKIELLRDFLAGVDREAARYITKILLNEFRIGLQQGLVEAAIARAWKRPLTAVRRASMLTGDLGATALLAKGDALEKASMRLFTPFEFMLAQPEEDPTAIVAQLGAGAYADDKYDGIRAQLHFDGTRVAIYSRTLDEITARFPEIAKAGAGLGSPVVLDGEIVAFRDGILPFAVLQSRIGRRKLTPQLLSDAPAVFFAFDVVFAGEVLLERPLHERLSILRGLQGFGDSLRVAEQTAVRDGAHVDALFDEARARGNEGLVVKSADSLYTPGRRGKSWLKYKKALATLDCVVTAAEYGHGKRRGVLSDYTFAVRSETGELVNIGKAYSGLTDVEIAALTKRFLDITTRRFGPVHLVDPVVVLEIAFDRIQESSRHKSGFALRFPRIARIRDDKTPEQISSIDEVRRIYEGQLRREDGAIHRPRAPRH